MGYLWIPIYIYTYIYVYLYIYIHTYWIPQFITFFIISFSMSSKISKLLSPQEWICSNKASPRTPVRNGAGFCIMKKGGGPRFPTSHVGIPRAGWFHGKSPKINGWFLEKWWMDVNGEHHTEHQTHRIMMIISLILKNFGSSNYLVFNPWISDASDAWFSIETIDGWVP